MSQSVRNKRHGESGQLTAFVAVLGFALVLVAGLVADGGGVLAAHQQAVSDAFEAARTGAQQLDQSALRSAGTVSVDPQAARSAALSYLGKLGETGTVSVNADSVTVTVSFRHPLAVLSAIGIGPVAISGTATASATQGITGAGS